MAASCCVGCIIREGRVYRAFRAIRTSVAVSINSWESATRAIDCVSLKPGGGGGGGAGSDPEILNDRAPSAVHARVPFHVRTPPHCTPPPHYFTGPPYTGILAGL